jgi:hypothetical protein
VAVLVDRETIDGADVAAAITSAGPVPAAQTVPAGA